MIEHDIVDTHFHLQSIGENNYPWLEAERRDDGLEGNLDAIARDFLPEDYERAMNTLNIAAGIHIENGWRRDRSIDETRWLAELPERAGKPRGLVVYADLCQPNVDRTLREHCSIGPVCGVRQILNRHRDPRLAVIRGAELMQSDTWRLGFERLAAFDITFDLQIFPWQIGAASDLARSFPRSRIVLDHLGMPINRDGASLSRWRKSLQTLSGRRNVWLKLSGAFLGQAGVDFEAATTLLLHAKTLFAPDRVLLGSNLPVDSIYGGAPIIRRLWCRLLDETRREHRERLCRCNAAEAYHVEI